MSLKIRETQGKESGFGEKGSLWRGEIFLKKIHFSLDRFLKICKLYKNGFRFIYIFIFKFEKNM